MLLLPLYAEAKKNNSGKAEIKFTEKIHDFGTITDKGSVSHDFEFINSGDGNLVIIDATAECGCTRPDYPKNPIAPGKKGKIKVTFLPAGRRGEFDKTVTVKTNGEQRKVKLRIKGTIIPK